MCFGEVTGDATVLSPVADAIAAASPMSTPKSMSMPRAPLRKASAASLAPRGATVSGDDDDCCWVASVDSLAAAAEVNDWTAPIPAEVESESLSVADAVEAEVVFGRARLRFIGASSAWILRM